MDKREEKIQEEIIRRAVQKSEMDLKEKEKILQAESVMESLQEVTGLSGEELEKISKEVRDTYPADGKDFFSIKNQLKTAGIIGLIVIGLIFLIVLLL